MWKNQSFTAMFLTALVCASPASAASPDAMPERPAPTQGAAIQTIAALDVPRYMGVWYEIAKFPNRFQRKCISNTRAEYRLNPEGTVQVFNRCKTSGGEVMEAVGEARQLGAASSPKLEVRFAPAWLSFLPMVWGDYWVIDLDDRYQIAAVSDSRREYLWILSRTPQIPAPDYQRLLARLATQGFDTHKLETTTQD